MKPYASDCLVEAMSLAQIKALNSFTFTDCLQYLNYAWSDIYSRAACIDDGYYAQTVRITRKETILPRYVKNSILVYRAQEANSPARQLFRASGWDDLGGRDTYHISGNKLYVPAAEQTTVWLRYVPACPELFFTHRNRDPKILDQWEDTREKNYGLYALVGRNPYIAAESYDPSQQYWEYDYANGKWVDATSHVTVRNFEKYFVKQAPEDVADIDVADTSQDLSKVTQWILLSRADSTACTDITKQVRIQGSNWSVEWASCDFPYIFLSYKHIVTGEHKCGFLDRDMFYNPWNGFDWTGRGTNCSYVYAKHNDRTGLAVHVKDWNDLDQDGNPKVKEIGWTPDTLLDYPCPEMYRYLVARLAEKFAALNDSNIMGVEKELAEAKYAFEAFLDKDKSSWKRINNVNPANIADYL